MQYIKAHLTLMPDLTSLEIVILDCPNFDDELLTILAQGIPKALTALTLDFNG